MRMSYGGEREEERMLFPSLPLTTPSLSPTHLLSSPPRPTQNSSEIVRELLDYLLVADWGIKEEMVLKIAILAERYAPNYQWYVNTILQLITTAGDFVSDDVWHRAMQIISQHAPLQRYSAKRLHQVRFSLLLLLCSSRG
tara:strand:- start:40 stop:459 length:420 start_codon:yes stop_codon:yes gene_type:complete